MPRRTGVTRAGAAALAAGVIAAALAGPFVAAGPAAASGGATTTSLYSLLPDPVGYGATAVITVAVSGPSPGDSPIAGDGTVDISDGDGLFSCPSAALDASGHASCASAPAVLAPGSEDPVTAGYEPGSSGFGASSVTASLRVAQAATAISVTIGGAVVGDRATITATLATTGGAGPLTVPATLSFSDTDGVIAAGSCSGLAVVDGAATCTTAPLEHSASDLVTVSYPGSTDYAATETSATLEVQPASTSIAVSPTSGVVGGQATLTATVSPVPDGGAVRFSDTGGVVACAAATVSDGSASCTSAVLTTAGSDEVTAAYLGNADYSASPASAAALSIGPGPTTLSLQASPSSPGVASTVTVTATLSPPVDGGSVSFSDGAGALSDCTHVELSASSASCTSVTLATAGEDQVTARYSGDADYQPADASLGLGVVPDQPVLSATATPAAPAVGESVVLTATLEPVPDGGDVAFSDADGLVAGCSAVPLSGASARCTTAPLAAAGVDPVTVTYLGDANYRRAGPYSLALYVNAAATSISLAASPPAPRALTSTTVVATVSPAAATGALVFSDSEGALVGCGAVPIVAGTASCGSAALPTAGTDEVQVSYAGDANDLPASAGLALVVAQVPTTLGLSASAAPIVAGQSTTLTAAVVPAPAGGTVSFSEGGSPVAACTALPVAEASCELGPFPAAGSEAIVAAYSGDGDDAASSAPFTLVVSKAASTASISLSPPAPEHGAPLAVTVAVTPAPPAGGATVAFADDAGPLAGCGAVPIGAGGTATCHIASVAATGPDTLTAAFSGTAAEAASTASSPIVAASAPSISGPASLTLSVGTVLGGPGDGFVLGGYPQPTLSTASPLPAGVTLSRSGQLAGTPAPGSGGVYDVVLVASSGTEAVSAQLDLAVEEAPVILGATSAAFAPGSYASLELASAPGTYPPPSFSESGPLPAGVGFSDRGDGTAVISGTPTGAAPGSYRLAVEAANAAGSSPPLTIDLLVSAAPPTKPPPAAPPPPGVAVLATAPQLSLTAAVTAGRRQSVASSPPTPGLGPGGALPARDDLLAGPGGAPGGRVPLGPLAGFPSLGNVGTAGDCTIVAVSSVARADHRARRLAAPPPATTTEAVRIWHRLNGGGGGGLLDSQLLHAWHARAGLLGTRLVSWRRLDVLDTTELKRAIRADGALYADVVIPADAEPLFARRVWSLPTPPAAALGGHAVAIVGWERSGLLAVTWGRLVLIPYSWWRSHATSAYAVRLEV